MRRPMSPQLQRALELGAREGQARDVAGVIRCTLEQWTGAPRMTAVRPAGSGAVMFDVQLNGKAFSLTVEPLTAEHAERISWQSTAGAQQEVADAAR